MSDDLAVVLVLVRQRMRRDRWQLLFWVAGTGLLALVSAVGVANTYGDEAARNGILSLAISSPAILLLRGLPQGGGLDAFVFFEIFTYLALLAALMSTFLAVRHTRAEEESGRAELISSTPASRTLPAVATVVHGLVANVLVGAATWLGMLGGGLAMTGSLVTGVATAAVGTSFLGVGMLAAQAMRTARGANGVSSALVGLAFVLRGVGDALGTQTGATEMVSRWPSWLSPIGWAQHTGAFTTNTLLPLLLNVTLAVVCFAAVLMFQGHRDTGASLLSARSSRTTAGALLSGTFGLAWRLHWPAVVGWSLGGAATGLLAGTLTGLVQQAAEADPSIGAALGRIGSGSGASGSDPDAMTQALIGALFTIAGALAAGCAVQAIIRMRQEEASGTAELLLAAPVSRVRLLADYVVLGAIATVAVLAAATLAAVVGLVVSGQPSSLFGDVTAAAAAQLPAGLVYLGIAVLLFVLVPRTTIGAGWGLLALGIVVGIFGGLIGLPDWLRNISPFTHTPVTTGSTTDWSGGVWMLVVALALVGASVLFVRRRELASG